MGQVLGFSVVLAANDAKSDSVHSSQSADGLLSPVDQAASIKRGKEKKRAREKVAIH